MIQEVPYYDIPIENEPLLVECGFKKFRLPLNGNATKMVLYNDRFKSMITYVAFDKRNSIEKAVKLLRDKLLDEQSIRDESVIEALCTYFRNACVLLQEDPDSQFFKDGNGNGKAKTTTGKARLATKKKTKEQIKSKLEEAQKRQHNQEKEREERIAAIAKNISSAEEWQATLSQKYNQLYNMVQKLLPNSWHSKGFMYEDYRNIG